MKRFFPIILIIFIVFSFFNQFFLQKKLPIPADTIIGLYHPFRDLYAKDYPNGIPYKNFLITDPVRQQYPWKKLALSDNLQLPFWNPYSFGGTPLLANFQSSFFYPLNFLLVLFPFNFGWGLFIISQQLLAGIFMYLYLTNLKLNKLASLLGSLAFTFSGFSISWLEWGTVLHTALWLPLILLSIDKVFYNLSFSNNSQLIPSAGGQNTNLSFDTGIKTEGQFKNKNLVLWSIVFLFSVTASLLAGHLQTFFYLFLFSTVYFFVRWFKSKSIKILFLYLILNIIFLILTFVQWFPTLQFILLSARDVHLSQWQNPGWFIPWEHLIQFLAPDFFGNPSTLNYFGTWNYAELVGYVGIFPLIMSFFALFFRKDKKVFLFGIAFFLSLIFALPTFFAKMPFVLKMPFISSSQPTRLLFITDFSLAVLTALGFDYFQKNNKKILYPLLFFALCFTILWSVILLIKNLPDQDLNVAKQNLILPSIIFLGSSSLLLGLKFIKGKKITLVLSFIIVMLTVFDLLRFSLKFTPFTNANYLFPQTKTIEFIEKNIGDSRIISADLRILPPNFSVIYKIQSIDGYDPLYLKTYGELISASENGIASDATGFGFDRIISPQNYESKIVDLLGVKYILSLSDLKSTKLKKIFQEGETRIYENKDVVPRVFFVEDLKIRAKQDILKEMIKNDFNPRKTAFVEDGSIQQKVFSVGDAEIVDYKENLISINTENKGEGFLLLSDSYYPTWKATIDGNKTTIYLTDYSFRGIIVPKGKHVILFYNKLF